MEQLGQVKQVEVADVSLEPIMLADCWLAAFSLQQVVRPACDSNRVDGEVELVEKEAVGGRWVEQLG